jgi:two-component system nitrogen regulation response regulator GlnG/two-component system response regulator HydG
VLLHGPSGSGKELAASAIHALSARVRGPFVARNAATFPEGLVDAEVFGTAKDYPNAGMPRRPGLVAEADGGCLFLDEIGELPPALQAHLLRVMDRGGEFQRLGEAAVSHANVRFLAATSRDPSSLKHDFLARFKLRVAIPGLDERREDIPLLLLHLIQGIVRQDPLLAERLCEQSSDGTWNPRIDPLLVDKLLRHRYTSHTRELERFLLSAIAGSRANYIEFGRELEQLFDVDDTAASVGAEPTAEDIRRALERAQGNVTRAAAALGFKNRFALYRLMKKLGMPVREEEGS